MPGGEVAARTKPIRPSWSAFAEGCGATAGPLSLIPGQRSACSRGREHRRTVIRPGKSLLATGHVGRLDHRSRFVVPGSIHLGKIGHTLTVQARLEWVRVADRDFAEDGEPVNTKIDVVKVEGRTNRLVP